MRFATPFLAGLLLPAVALAQPAIDGDCDDAQYLTQATYTQGHGFGDYGLTTLKGYRDATHLYLCVGGTTENNFNSLYLWLDLSNDATGTPAGTPLPSGGGGFEEANPTMELPTTDFGVRLTHDASAGYINVVNYDGGSASNTYIGSLAVDGTGADESQGSPYAGARFAYSNYANLSANTDGKGFEIRFELADLGATAATTFQMMAAYASSNGDFFSSDVLPEVPGNGSTNLGSDPNFVTLTGTQATAGSALPVELSSFTAVADGDAAVVRWMTESETNNAGFDLQTLRRGAWTTVASTAGRGTTSERTRYEERVDGLAAGRHTFRLVQRDLDGTATIAGTVELVVGSASALVAEARGASVRFGAASAQPLTVEAFDVLGRRVATLFAGTVEAGSVQSADLDGVAPGVYVVRVSGRAGAASTTLVVR